MRRAHAFGRGRSWLLVAAFAATAQPAVAAAAVGDKVEARRHFQVGVAAAEAGAYGEAVIEFTRAYELSPNFAVLYNIARAQAALGDEPAALATFERYLGEGGQAIPSARRAEVAGEMKELIARTGLIVPQVLPETARLILDGTPLQPGASGRGVRVKVGAHKVTATKGGYAAAEQTVTVASGDSVEVTLTLFPLPEPPRQPVAAAPALAPAPAPAAAPQPVLIQLSSPPAPPAPPSGSALRTLGYVVGGVGLAGLVTGGALYADSWLQAQNAINNGCSQNLNTCRGSGRAEWQDALNYAKAAEVFAAAGGAILVGGAVMLFVAPSGSGTPPSVALVGHW